MIYMKLVPKIGFLLALGVSALTYKYQSDLSDFYTQAKQPIEVKQSPLEQKLQPSKEKETLKEKSPFIYNNHTPKYFAMVSC